MKEPITPRIGVALRKKMLTRKALLVSVLCSVVFLCPLVYSQANGSLSGTVADKTGSVITGATVKITFAGNRPLS